MDYTSSNGKKPAHPHPLDHMDAARRAQLEARSELLLETAAYCLPQLLELLGLEAVPDERWEEFEIWRARAQGKRARLDAQRGREDRCR